MSTVASRLNLPVAQGEELGVAWSRDGSRIAALSPGHSVSLWDPFKGTLKRFLKDTGCPPQGAAIFSPDSSRIACVVRDGRIQLWDCNSGEPVSVESHNRFAVPVLCWSPQASTIALFRDGSIELWDSYTGSPVRQIAARQDVVALAWSPTGESLAACGRSGVRVWSKDLLPRRRMTGFAITCLAWGNGSLLFAAEASGAVQIWNTGTGSMEGKIVAHNTQIVDMSVSADGLFLASKAIDGTLQCSLVESRSIILSEAEGVAASECRMVQFHPTLPILATADPVKKVIAIRRFSEPKPERAAISVFFSYSHDDIAARRKLREFLSPLEVQGRVAFWDDDKLRAGDNWEEDILTRLNRADVIVCLISAAFLASKFCNREMDRALERHNSGDARVIPVILSDALVDELPIYKLHAEPQYDKRVLPISKWDNQAQAYTTVARSIGQAIEQVRGNGQG